MLTGRVFIFCLLYTSSDKQNDNSKSDIGNYLTQKVMDLIVFFRWILTDMTSRQQSLLDELILKTYEKCGLTYDRCV